MASKTQVTLVDDLDGANVLRKILGPYAAASRRLITPAARSRAALPAG